MTPEIFPILPSNSEGNSSGMGTDTWNVKLNVIMPSASAEWARSKFCSSSRRLSLSTTNIFALQHFPRNFIVVSINHRTDIACWDLYANDRVGVRCMASLCLLLYTHPEIMLTLAPVSRTNVIRESFTRAVTLGVFVDVGGIIMNTDSSLDVERDTEEWVKQICLAGLELRTLAKWFV